MCQCCNIGCVVDCNILCVFTEATKNMTVIREKLKFPSDEDLTGAAVALMRLQDTYKLDTASLARGELNGVQYSTQLSGNCLHEVKHFMNTYF